jgi:DNA alkylation repair enzyme
VTPAGEPVDPAAVAGEIDREIRALAAQGVQPVRAVRRAWSRRLGAASAEAVVEVALALVDRQRWVAYELLASHPGGLDHWVSRRWSGWGRGWPTGGRWMPSAARSRDRPGGGVVSRMRPSTAGRSPRTGGGGGLRWSRPCRSTCWSRGGTGDPGRTLDICRRLAGDGDDMVVKALSWALRELVVWDPEAVRRFLDAHHEVLAARVRREVRSKHPARRAT